MSDDEIVPSTDREIICLMLHHIHTHTLLVLVYTIVSHKHNSFFIIQTRKTPKMLRIMTNLFR